MSELLQYKDVLVYMWSGLAVIVFVLLFFIPAPYGRHARTGWGPMIPARIAWFVMELVSPLVLFAAFFISSQRPAGSMVMMGLWLGHYFYRALVFPFLMSPKSHAMPLSVVLMSIMFNTVNAGANGIYLFYSSATVSMREPAFYIGIALFVTGFVIHVLSDRKLRHLRRTGKGDYSIPRGGLFEYVSCPNYLGELIEWTGWAIAVWNPAGMAFALWTAANLVPRALTHHRWYNRKFSDYPKNRKAVVPFIL